MSTVAPIQTTPHRIAGRKRAAPEDTAEKRETRSSKVAKTEGAKATGRAAKGTARLKVESDRPSHDLPLIFARLDRSSQTHMAQSAFKSRAVPLYVNITTTPPAPEGQEPAPADPGFLASTSLAASTFATGSFGWKGHKRMTVELPAAEGEEGENEKLHVMLTYVCSCHVPLTGYQRVRRINATVIGSKDVKEVEEHEGEHEGPGEHATEEASSQAAKEGEPQGAEAKEGGDNPPAGEGATS